MKERTYIKAVMAQAVLVWGLLVAFALAQVQIMGFAAVFFTITLSLTIAIFGSK